MKKYRVVLRIIAVVLVLFLALFRQAPRSLADGGLITLSVSNSEIKMGEVFTIVCRVSSATQVFDADFYVDYDTTVLQFIEGGPKASKEPGSVHIQSVDNTEAAPRRTFSLQFMAKEAGTGSVFVRDGAHVVDGEGNALSLNTEKLDLVVAENEEAQASGEPEATEMPVPTEPTVNTKQSGNNKVLVLSTNAQDMIPDFDPTVQSYDVLVASETDTFFIDYVLDSKKATARIKGNKNLVFGDNKVKLVVTAENGDKRSYVFMVTRPDPVVENVNPDDPTVSGAAVDPSPLDKDGEKGYSIVLYIIIGLLLVFAIAMISLVRRQRRELEYYYEEELEEQRETENDRRSGESDLEGGKVRGEDGDFHYWD
ncbi:MAG: cadherin-like beta sandwich domain-containing protein [Eubacterium sp.]|nr:cadherin-like beta sandwich domain-containing protein [Eubacterium sp.]